MTTLMNNAAHFIFDSNHIDDIESRLYGFYTTKNGLFTETIPSEDITDATGAWVLVRCTQKGIEITQDSIGCFGLFLFRDKNYWALSNSFNHLLDYLKSAHKLTFNKDFADALLSHQFFVSVYEETIIREIQWIDRRAKIHIDFNSSELAITYRQLNESTISVDTMEGLRLLDAWHDKWASYIRKAGQSWPGKIQVDVSGGFDTRMMLAPVLSSGIKECQVQYISKTQNHEDFHIASMIAEEFGFPLNKKNESSTFERLTRIGSSSERSLATIYFEKEIYLNNFAQSVVPTLYFKGFGGEMSRNYWRVFNCLKLMKEKIMAEDNTTRLFQRTGKVRQGAEAIMQRGFQGIDAMLKEINSDYISGTVNGYHYYNETGNRSHHGLRTAACFLNQNYIQNPLFDPLLLALRTPLDGNHFMLICAIILTRYHEELISFPFDDGRTIAEETIQYAQELNRRFPRKINNITSTDNDTENTTWQPFRIIAKDEAVHSNHKQQPETEQIQMDEKLVRAFDSATVQKVIKKLYGKSFNYYLNPNFEDRHQDAAKYTAVAIAKAWYDVKKGKKAPKDFTSFIEACLSETK